MTVAEKIALAITNQQAEVARLQDVVRVDLPAAQAKLQTLQTLLTKATPNVETLIAQLEAAGVHLDS